MRIRKLTLATMVLILLGVAALGYRWRQQQGPESADASGRTTAPKPIGAKDLMGFNFPMDAEAGTVAGRITDARGAPLPQASVVVMPVVVGREMWTRMAEMDVLASAMTDADGRYLI